MLRFLSLIARNPAVSSQEFHDHWRHPHGTMGRLIPGMINYVQAHQIDSSLLDADQSEYEGVAISAWDSADAAMGLLSDPQYVNQVQPDESYFQNLDKNVFFSTTEEVLLARRTPSEGGTPVDAQWNELERPVSIQLLQFVLPDGAASWAGDDDRELGLRIGAFRHARNWPSADVHGDHPPMRGARQLWWPTISAFEQGVAGDRAAFASLVGRAGSSITLLAQSERFVR